MENERYTDSGTASLSQTPLRSPTVFNFYYPGYTFPGALASAGLTTPEFQLTTASGVAAQMNFIEGGILNNTGNTNGLSRFTTGNGSIVLNIAPWMKTNFTSNARNTSFGEQPEYAAGRRSALSAGAQSNIISFVANTTNFTYWHTPDPNPDARPRSRRRSSHRQFPRLHHPET